MEISLIKENILYLNPQNSTKKDKLLPRMQKKKKIHLISAKNKTSHSKAKASANNVCYSSANALNILIKVFAHGLLRPSAKMIFLA